MYKLKLGFDGYVRDADGAMIPHDPNDPNWVAAQKWVNDGNAPGVIIDAPFYYQQPGSKGYPVLVSVPGVSLGDAVYAVIKELSALKTPEFTALVNRIQAKASG